MGKGSRNRINRETEPKKEVKKKIKKYRKPLSAGAKNAIGIAVCVVLVAAIVFGALINNAANGLVVGIASDPCLAGVTVHITKLVSSAKSINTAVIIGFVIATAEGVSYRCICSASAGGKRNISALTAHFELGKIYSLRYELVAASVDASESLLIAINAYRSISASIVAGRAVKSKGVIISVVSA